GDHRDGRAEFSELLRRRFTDATAGTRHDRDGPCQLVLHLAADDHALLDSHRPLAADVSSQRSFAGVSVALPMGAPTGTLYARRGGVVSMAWTPPTRSASSSPRGARNSRHRRWGCPTSVVAAGFPGCAAKKSHWWQG